MITQQQKQFITDTLLPYIQDPNTCGIDKEECICMYLTPQGNSCALGKYMKPGPWQYHKGDAYSLFEEHIMEEVLTESALSIDFNVSDWAKIQNVHDSLALMDSVEHSLKKLELHFNTEFKELKEALDHLINKNNNEDN